MKTFHLKTKLLCAALALWMSPLFAWAIDFDIAPPESGSHIRDLAELITADDEALIDAWCAALQLEHTVPVAVVTIESMGQYGAENMHVETFARGLFEQWGDDPAFNPTDDWRRGVLLLISKGDRKARIELGGTWPPDYISRCVRIMDTVIVPRFKQGDFSGGAVSGVEAIVEMVRGESPAAPATVPTSEAAPPARADAPVSVPVTSAPVSSRPPGLVHNVSYPAQQVYHGGGGSGMPPLFGFGVFGVVVLMLLKAIGGGLGGGGYTDGSYRNYGPRHHHHLYSQGGHYGVQHFGGSSFGGHDHGGGSSGVNHGGISHGGGSHGGASHGGGGGATGSW